MIQSMTGFGRAEQGGFRVEVRSLNHRYIDISARIPTYLIQHEVPLRNLIKEKFRRGKFDVTVSVDVHTVTHVTINRQMAKKIYDAFQELQRDFLIPGQIDISTLAGYKELLIEEEPKYDIDALYVCFREALAHLEAMRLKEGSLISEEIRQRAKSLGAMNNRIKSLIPNFVTKCRERFSEKLDSLLGETEIDNARLMQEAAIMAEKLDISEEVERIENHIKQFLETLEREDVVGRKLDFLLQEINREVNTIGSKSSDYAISSLMVEMKIEIEKIREQVQNIQ
ncbi:MAG: YicC family protein [Nitrospira sp.]|nr:YicC family protein [Nitrospira sp.]